MLPKNREEASDNTLAAMVAMAALLLYVPAVTLPFLQISRLGWITQNSVLTGVATLFREGHVFVGGVVLLFSLVLPPFKLGLLMLLSLRSDWLAHRNRRLTFQLVEHMGRWGMLDVLLVAVMIAFIKLGSIVSFGAGVGLPLFASFVVTSLFAGLAFNPHALWSAQPDETTPQPGSRSLASTPPEAAGTSPPSFPAASEKRPRPSRRGWLWLIPILAVIVAGGVTWRFLQERGRVIEIAFADGRGLTAGNEVRHRGIPAGYVEHLRFDGEGVVARVRLTADGDALARRGTRFWIVRPQLDLAGISGLETIVGAKYIAVKPGDKASSIETRFIGLEAPILEDLDFPGGVEVILQAPAARSVRAGLPVHYRHLRVGGVREVALATDGSAIEAHVYIRPQFMHLIRAETHFWNASGVNLSGGLTEFQLHIGPVESWMRGGIELAVPPEAGEPVDSGHRFPLHPAPERAWLAWTPALSADNSLPAAPRPTVVPVTLEWRKDGWFWDSDASLQGSIVVEPEGLVGLTELLSIPPQAVPGSVQLRLPDRALAVGGPDYVLEPTGPGLSRLRVPGLEAVVPRMRRIRQPEDGYLVADAAGPPVLVAATRFVVEGNRWVIDFTLPLSESLHGAPLIAKSDGALLGFIDLTGDERLLIRLQDPDEAN